LKLDPEPVPADSSFIPAKKSEKYCHFFAIFFWRSTVKKSDKYGFAGNFMDAAMLVHMKEGKTYEEWEGMMLSFYDNKKEVEEGKIVYGKVNDQTAMIFRFDFDPDEMAKRLEDLEVMEKVNAVVEKREMFSISPIQRP